MTFKVKSAGRETQSVPLGKMSLLYQIARRIYGDYHEKQSSWKGGASNKGGQMSGVPGRGKPIDTAVSMV